MKTYQGTKVLDARPMSRGEYNAYRGWQMPEGENATDAGYLVEYRDGGKANDSRHVGYISWSPADVFERTYKPVYAPHQQRVVDEHESLTAKLGALENFFSGSIFSTLPSAEQDRLHHQAAHMRGYATVLSSRIAAF